jgi:hypothetical protein
MSAGVIVKLFIVENWVGLVGYPLVTTPLATAAWALAV